MTGTRRGKSLALIMADAAEKTLIMGTIKGYDNIDLTERNVEICMTIRK